MVLYYSTNKLKNTEKTEKGKGISNEDKES